jgi:hypothetical protein
MSQPTDPQRLAVVLAGLGIIAAIGVVAVLLLARGDSRSATGSRVPVGLAPASSSQPPSLGDFPSAGPAPSGSDTDTASLGSSGARSATAEQRQVAASAEAVIHALGSGNSSTFCARIDPADLVRLLKEKNISECADIQLKTPARKPIFASVAVLDPSQIGIARGQARIPASDISPLTFGEDVLMRKDTDGRWKYRFYTD